jgi:hypothetical protein
VFEHDQLRIQLTKPAQPVMKGVEVNLDTLSRQRHFDIPGTTNNPSIAGC